MIEDLSKRSDAIKVTWHEPTYTDPINVLTEVRDRIEAIPSADKPQGEWIKFGLGRGTRFLFCTNCKRRIEVPLSQGDSNYDFCPNCGARMKGVDDD